MLRVKLFGILFLITASCSTKQQHEASDEARQKVVVQDTSDYPDKYASLMKSFNKKNIAQNGSYYILTTFLDSTVKITWGNDTINRIYDEPFDFMIAERLSLKWENKDYIILHHWTGTNAWGEIALPLNREEPVQVFENGLYYDQKDNFLVQEENRGDTIMSVNNLKTREKQFIMEKQHPCGLTPYGCVGGLSTQRKVLYYKWETSGFSEIPNYKAERLIRL